MCSAFLALPGACQERDTPVAVPAGVPPPPSDFARFVPVGDDEGKFEVALTTYRNGEGVEVSLISAVHIADDRHYRELQAEFERYDALLYELVAEPDERPSPGGAPRARSGVGLLQALLKNGLELEFQLDAIDYDRPNFVHADLTPDGFAAAMEERGESFFSMFVKLAFQQMSMAQKQGAEAKEVDGDIVSAFRRGYGRHTMRMNFAKQLESLERMAAGGGPGGGTTLLEGRNARALEVLAEQLAEGHDRLAIYYGAAHMTGIEQALVGEMGFTKVGHRWLVAWDLSKRPDRKPGKQQPNKQDPGSTEGKGAPR